MKKKSILQSQFIEKGFKKAENSKQYVVLLLFLFTQKEELVDPPNESTSVVKICLSHQSS